MEKDVNSRWFLSLPYLSSLWQMNPDDYTGIRRYLIKYARVILMLFQDFFDDRCLLRASALSFTTVLSFIPFLALAFSVLKGLGVHNTVQPFLLARLTAGSQELVGRVITYIDRTNMASVGAIGVIALIITVVSVLSNVEEAFNEIWGVWETRSWGRKFSDYLSVAISTPILFFAATSVTTSLQSHSLLEWVIKRQYLGDVFLFIFNVVPYVSIWMALVFLYVVIPNTKVSLRSALIGGLLTGIIWQIAQWFYITLQLGVSKYNAVYGTLSALPIFMIWIYTSWIIVLFGVELVYAHQNRKTFLREIHQPFLNYAGRENTALVLLLLTAEAYYRNSRPWTSQLLATETGLPVRVIKELLAQLIDLGYLAATEGEPTYIPARAPEHMDVRQIIEELKHYGEPLEIQGRRKVSELLQDISSRLKPCPEDGDGLTIKDLVVRLMTDELEQR